jgi:ubiquinone biosynthesis protein Coq4
MTHSTTVPWQDRGFDALVDCIKCQLGDFPVLQRLNDVMHDGGGDADRLLDLLGRNATCAEVLAEGTPLKGLDIGLLIQLPAGTLGQSYAAHMVRNGLKPPPIPDHLQRLEPKKFVQRRLLESHDIWHVVLDFDTDTVGEIGLGAFNVGQMPTRFFTGMLAKNLAKVALEDIQICSRVFHAVDRGLTLATRLPPLFGYRWDEHWAEPLSTVRAAIGLHDEAVQHALPSRRTIEVADGVSP